MNKKNKINKYFTKTLLSIILLNVSAVLGIGFVGNQNTIKAYDTSTVLQGGTVRKEQGSTYWQTSNLREWLNSNASSGNVQYTQTAPTTSNDYGFLNQFTQEEQNSIAVTKHKALLTYEDANQVKDGGNYAYSSGANIGFGAILPYSYSDLLSSYSNWVYQNVNDKVYIPTIYDVYRYVEARNQSIQKTLTPQAKAKNQITNDPSTYWLNMPDNGMVSTENNHIINPDPNNVQVSAHAAQNEGVVPIIYIKPDTKINNTTASNLKINDTVTFGKYLNAPIEWTVINKVNGYAMLMTKHVIDFKQFDNAGDYSYAKSKYINYPTSDIDVTNYPVTANDGSSNTTVPLITVADDSKLTSRQNSAYTLHFNVTTYGNALDYVLLPDGTKTTSTSFDYTFSSNKDYSDNGDYIITAVDKAGNTRKLLIPVSNINPPSSVLITPSTTNWTNKPVTVDILANNNVGQSNYNSGMYSERDKWLYDFPNYTTYSGKKLHIKYTITGGTPTSTINPGSISIMLMYKALSWQDGQYVLKNQWVTSDSNGNWSSTDYNSLANGKSVTKEATFDVPANYNNSLSMYMHMDIQYDSFFYPYSISNFNLNLVDNDDFGVKSITLPNGTVVNSNSYTDTLTNNGTYTYSVLDSRGQTTKKTVTVNIDKIAPTINITGAPSTVVNTDVPLTATTADTGGSGVAQIQSPTGEWSTNSSLSYTANEEGNHTYTFGVKDNAGNVTNKSVTINIDKTAPTATITGNPTSTIHTPTTLNLTSSDENSGVQQVQTPDGVWHSGSTASYKVTENGNYTFKVQDKAGNIKTQTVNVTNIGSLAYVYNNDSGSLISDDSATISTANLNGKSQTLTTNTHQMQFGDTLGNNWQLSLNANQLSSGSHTLPTGTLILNKLNYTDNNSMLSNLLTSPTAIDDKKDKTILSSTKQSTNSYDLNPDYSVKIPANAYKGTYKTIINWKLNE